MYKQIIEADGSNNETFDKRLERLYEYQDKHRGKWPNVEAILIGPENASETIGVCERHLGHNICTSHGDIMYVKLIGGESITSGEGNSHIQVGDRSAVTPAKADTWGTFSNNDADDIPASLATFDSTYPKRNDLDSANTGKGTNKYTYKKTWATTDFSGTGISNGAIFGTATPVNATPVAHHWFFDAPFDKSTSQTMIVYVNAGFLGA